MSIGSKIVGSLASFWLCGFLFVLSRYRRAKIRSERSSRPQFLHFSHIICTDENLWSTKTCMCRQCALIFPYLLVPCKSRLGRKDLDTDYLSHSVRLDVGGYYEDSLSVEIKCYDRTKKTFPNSTAFLKGNNFLLGRTGPWGPGIAGLHARTIYDNVIPMLGALNIFVQRKEIRDTRIVVVSRRKDASTNNSMLQYLQFFKSEPIFLQKPYKPILFQKLVFGIAGRGFLSSYRYEDSMGKRQKNDINSFSLIKMNDGSFQHSGFTVPVEDFYKQFISYGLYRKLMYENFKIPYRRVKRYKNILIIDRTGQSRNWPFPVHSLKQEIRYRLPQATIMINDFSNQSLQQQMLITSMADVFVSIHGSNIVDRLFLQNGSISIIFYPNSGCFHQSDHVDRMVYWSKYRNFTFSDDMLNMQEDLSCGVYGQECCNTVTNVHASQVADLVVSQLEEQLQEPCLENYCCNFQETAEECQEARINYMIGE